MQTRTLTPAPGRRDERLLDRGVGHLLVVDQQALPGAGDEGEQLALRVGGRPDQVAPSPGRIGRAAKSAPKHLLDRGDVGPALVDDRKSRLVA